MTRRVKARTEPDGLGRLARQALEHLVAADQRQQDRHLGTPGLTGQHQAQRHEELLALAAGRLLEGIGPDRPAPPDDQRSGLAAKRLENLLRGAEGKGLTLRVYALCAGLDAGPTNMFPLRSSFARKSLC